jgi:hypothetical protein
MTKKLTLLVVILSTIAAETITAQNADRSTTDALMSTWITSLQSENIEGFASCYWPDATLFSFNPNGNSSLLEGVGAIKSNQATLFAAFDYKAMNLTYPQALRFPSMRSAKSIYVYDNRAKFGYIEIFYLEGRSGEYRILNQVMTMGLAPPASQ